MTDKPTKPTRPPSSKSGADSKSQNLTTTSSSADIQKFLNQVAVMPKVSSGDARLVFALDATASRQQTWDVATQLQTEMFQAASSLGGLQVQLCYFRGFSGFYTSNWQAGSKDLLKRMSGIRCEAGATQIKRVLRHVLRENDRGKIKCAVYIGDAMEENIDLLAQLAGKLGLLNIPLFMFQEGSEPIARSAFLEMTRLSRGAYGQFDSSSVAQLKELLRAVAVYAAGGLKALESFSKTSGPEVKRLEQQLRN